MSKYKELTNRLEDLESDIRKIDSLKGETMYDVDPPRQIRELTMSLVTTDGYRKSLERLRDLETVSNQQIDEVMGQVLDDLQQSIIYEYEDLKHYITDIEQALLDDEAHRIKKKTLRFLGDF